MDIRAASELSGAVVEFEGRRHFSAGFTGQQGLIELGGEFEGGLHGGYGKAAASRGGGGDRGGGGADDIDSDDRPALAVTGDAFRQVINYDRFAHGIDHPFL